MSESEGPLDAAARETGGLPTSSADTVGEAGGVRGSSADVAARVPQLLECMRTVGTGLELHATLDRICRTAAEPADARCAAIGVVDAEGEGLSDFVTSGVSEEVVRRIGRPPDGRRVLLGAPAGGSGPALPDAPDPPSGPALPDASSGRES